MGHGCDARRGRTYSIAYSFATLQDLPVYICCALRSHTYLPNALLCFVNALPNSWSMEKHALLQMLNGPM